MTILQPCLDCGTPSDANRCMAHRPTHPAKMLGRLRGYDTAWRRLSERARTLQPFCVDCGATYDLQADHTPEAWRRKAAGKPIRLQDIAVVCGPCNRRRGAARGGGAHRPLVAPLGKAKYPLLSVTDTCEDP